MKKGASLWRFLELAKSGAIPRGSVLLIEHVDRLSRLPWQEGLNLFTTILHSGIDIATSMDGQIYTAERLAKDMGCIFVLMMYLCQANEQSDTKSVRGADRWKRNRAAVADGKRIGMRRPAWIKKDRTVDDKKADVIRRIFTMACDGLGSKAITRTLNGEGVPPVGQAKQWTTGLVQYYLGTRTVLGELQFKKLADGKLVDIGEPIAGYYPGIVDPVTFAKAARVFAERKRHDVRGRIEDTPNVFVGLMKNLYDGSTYFVKSGKWTSGHSDTYYASKRLVPFKGNVGVAGSMNLQLNYAAFESSFFRFVNEIDVAALFTPEDKTSQASRLAECQDAMIEVEERRKLFRERIKTAKNKASILDMLEEADEEHAVLEAEIQQLKSVLTTSESVIFADLRGDLADPASRPKIASTLRLLIDGITVLPVHTGTGAHRRTQYLLYVEVEFNNGRRRWYVTDQDGTWGRSRFERDEQAVEIGNTGASEFRMGVSRWAILDKLTRVASDAWREKLQAWLRTSGQPTQDDWDDNERAVDALISGE